MQVAKATELYKAWDKNGLGNYRPIPVLPVFSKALEKKIMHQRLYQIRFYFLKDIPIGIHYMKWGINKTFKA